MSFRVPRCCPELSWTLTAPLALVLVTGGLAARSAFGAKQGDELGKVFGRWFRDYQAGRIDPDDTRGAIKKPYLTRRLVAQLPPQLGKYDRLREAEDLFTLLEKRGSMEDAARLLRVVEVSLGRKGGKFWERSGKYTRVRRAVIDVLTTGPCPPTVQDEIARRVRQGFPQRDGDSRAGAAPLKHREPELATTLLPVLGHFGHASWRRLFEDCLRVEHSGMQGAAARALASMGYGRSVAAVARALGRARYSDDVAVLAGSIVKLVAAGKPAPTERDLKFTINVALDKFATLEDWRARIALIPILRSIRSRGSVPVLIAFLEDAHGKMGKSGKEGRPYSGTLMSAAHAALVDLTGFYAGAREPEKWRSWWESVKGTFALAPPRRKQPAKGGTVAQGFFGIPVTGNRVAFVMDVSGSMEWPYETSVLSRKDPDQRYQSRLQRAKAELLKALSEMPPNSKFTVVFFSSDVRVWKKKLVWANAQNKKAIEAYLEQVKAVGGTALYDGLNKAMQIRFEKRKEQPYGSVVDEIFLLSDGSPTLGTKTNTDEILDVVRTWNNGAQVRVHAIFIGDEKVDRIYAPPNTVSRLEGNMPPEEFMRKLAEQNHGRFVEPNKGG